MPRVDDVPLAPGRDDAVPELRHDVAKPRLEMDRKSPQPAGFRRIPPEDVLPRLETSVKLHRPSQPAKSNCFTWAPLGWIRTSHAPCVPSRCVAQATMTAPSKR